MNVYLSSQFNKEKMQTERAHGITRKMGHAYGHRMQNTENIPRLLCRSLVAFSVGLAGTPRDCDEHSVPSGRFHAALGRPWRRGQQCASERLFFANGFRVKDRLMAVMVCIKNEWRTRSGWFLFSLLPSNRYQLFYWLCLYVVGRFSVSCFRLLHWLFFIDYDIECFLIFHILSHWLLY